jgi:hypothetical protein
MDEIRMGLQEEAGERQGDIAPRDRRRENFLRRWDRDYDPLLMPRMEECVEQ